MLRFPLLRALIGCALVAQGSPALFGQAATPAPTPAYAGAEADAAWRGEANKRIEKTRKADLLISVRNRAGKPVKDAEVVVHQQMHAFHFGGMIRPELLSDKDTGTAVSSDDRQHYRQVIIDLFNVVIPPSDASDEDKAAAKAWADAHEFKNPTPGKDAVDVPSEFSSQKITPPRDLWTQLEALAKKNKGKALRAPDYRFIADSSNPEELQLQANFTRDYFTLLFSHPRVTEILLDAFWQAPGLDSGWALYDEKWQPRPVGESVNKLIKKLWWTDDNALTNAAGTCAIRCFLGDYRVTISAAGKTKTINATVDARGAKVALTLD